MSSILKGRTKTLWTAKRVQKAVGLYKKGCTLSKIAEMLGSNKLRVKHNLRKAGIEVNRPRGCFPQGAKNPSWNKEGRREAKGGYVELRIPWHPMSKHGWVLEHRFVMEQILGRFLKKGEVVHHKDRNKKNNDPSNLVLFASNGLHLASELAGKCPMWTKDGLDRLRSKVWDNTDWKKKVRDGQRAYKKRRKSSRY